MDNIFEKVKNSGEAIRKLLQDYYFITLLDIGCGNEEHSKIFEEYGKKVTKIDLGTSHSYKKMSEHSNNVIHGDYLYTEFEEKFDCIWCSHVLEHQVNVQAFLDKVYRDLKWEGIFAVTVPPYKDRVSGGHVSAWNIGLLMLRLAMTGIDCREAIAKRYGNNLSVIVQKLPGINIDKLVFDMKDIRILEPYLPEELYDPIESKRVSIIGEIDNIKWG